MSSTRQHPPGDLGPEPDGIASASEASTAPVTSASAVPTSGTAGASDAPGVPGGPDAPGVPGTPGASGTSAAPGAPAAIGVSALAAAAPLSVVDPAVESVSATGSARNGFVTASASPAASGGQSAGAPAPAEATRSAAQATAGPASASVSADAASSTAAAGTAAGQVRSLPLNDASGIVPLARDFTRQALYDWGWLPASTADRRAAAEDVLLVVSELVTNACLHAEGPESLRVASDGKVLRLEVTDRSGGEPAPRTPHRAGRPGGHGMFIVQRLCLDWGVSRVTEGADTTGKTVWAELAAPE